ncbi:hypothetical protein F5Y17DRAFT_435641 [Xylariaceae sp. FL0594]|nr:hypothetical protein F5Y17DRAFT_435641 [Xylariaceae sp. FL0594]
MEDGRMVTQSRLSVLGCLVRSLHLHIAIFDIWLALKAFPLLRDSVQGISHSHSSRARLVPTILLRGLTHSAKAAIRGYSYILCWFLFPCSPVSCSIIVPLGCSVRAGHPFAPYQVTIALRQRRERGTTVQHTTVPNSGKIRGQALAKRPAQPLSKALSPTWMCFNPFSASNQMSFHGWAIAWIGNAGLGG